ncbi:MAG: hypothetical protein OEZ43_07525 [Gammaproteobacteria bacterium]|nr:hypothetical protein [Gammaproteobacteria bacterium]
MINNSLILLFILGVSACASTGGKNCGPNEFGRNGMPCWVNYVPSEGVVVSMSEHFDPNQTRDVLFKKALVELSASQGGVEVSEDVIVHKKTTVINDNVDQQAKVVSLASVKTANESTNVKAKVKAYWRHRQTSKAYMWVIPE